MPALLGPEPAVAPANLLTLYLREPIVGTVEGGAAWQLDMFVCMALSPGDRQRCSPACIAEFHAIVVDRQERQLPIELLSRYDLAGGFALAMMDARSGRA